MKSATGVTSDPAPEQVVAVAEGYRRWAPLYDHTPNPLLAREERFLLPMLPDLHCKSVLDSACGTGRWLERLMALGSGSGVGIDSSTAMLQVAAHKSAVIGRLITASCEHLPLSNEAFDLVICSFAIGHISNLNNMARELARVTRSDADVFVTDLHPEACAQGWRVGFRDGAISLQIQTQYRSIAEIIEAFCSNGFKCQTKATLSLGEPEKPIFTQAGKTNFFVEACRMPAIFVCHFRRLDSTIGDGRAR
jgi:ubiquinone/menaquinone biosynthesis C-methylase UbiE